MSKKKDSDLDRRGFLSTSVMLVAGATAAANLPKNLVAAQAKQPAPQLTKNVEQTANTTAAKDRRQETAILSGTRDLSASIKQSAADKVLTSVNYPFCVFEQSWPFNGKAEAVSASYDYTQAQMVQMLKEAQAFATDKISPIDHSDEDQVKADVLRAAGEVIDSAKRALELSKEPGYIGPKEEEIKKILQGGVEGLLRTTEEKIKFKAHLAWLKVCVANQPSLRLGNPRITINGLHIRISATGELWWYHPTLHVVICCPPRVYVTWGWDRITHLTVNNIRIAADAHADTSTAGAIVNVRGSFDRLRLDYPILRNIPLEGIANQQLGDKLVRAFDASQFIASIPVMNSKFRIDKVELPASSNEIAIDLTVKQI